MSRSLKSSLNGQGRFKIPKKFRLKIPERGFGSCAIRNGFHKSFITNDLPWTLTWTTPKTAFVPGPLAWPAWALADRLRTGGLTHDA